MNKANLALRRVLKGKKVLITGGAGFIGSHLAEHVLRFGSEVIILDNFSTGKIENLAHLPSSRISVIRGNANRKSDVEKAFRYKPSFLFHLAATVGVDRTLKNPLLVLDDLNGLHNVLRLSLKHGVKKAVFSSSSEVYGEPVTHPQSEEHTPLNSRLPYAVVKSAGENFFRAYYEMHKLPTTSFRFFNVYGPRQDSSGYGFVVSIFIKNALSGKPPVIFGDGRQTRDFNYIDDVIAVLLHSLITPESDGESLNIGKGKEVRIVDLAEQIIKLCGAKGMQPVFAPARKKGDMSRRRANPQKLKKIIKYVPHTSLREGLKRTIAHLRGQT